MFARIVPFLVLIIALVECRPQINIEYKPNRPSFAPSQTGPSQIIPPGKPWPANPEGYSNFSQTPPPVDVANRWTGENSSTTNVPDQQNTGNAPASGSRPFFAGRPHDRIPQLVPSSGSLWPDSPEGYANFSQTPPPVDVVNRWTGGNSSSANNAPEQQNSGNAPASGSRPFFAGRPHDRIPQLVPSSGSLWPASPEGYANFSQTPPPVDVANRWTGGNSSSANNAPEQQNSGNAPASGSRPFFAGRPHDRIPQLVPSSGSLWPASPEGYANFSQTPSPLNVVDRWSGNSASTTSNSSESTGISSIGNRPFFASKPQVAQIVPPGASWPASPEGYANFSQVPDRFQQIGTTTTPSVLVNDLVNIELNNLTHIKPEETTVDCDCEDESSETTPETIVSSKTTPKITTYRGTTPRITTLEGITDQPEQVTSRTRIVEGREETTERSDEITENVNLVGDRLQQTSTTSKATNDEETTEASVPETSVSSLTPLATTLVVEIATPSESLSTSKIMVQTNTETTTEMGEVKTSRPISKQPVTEAAAEQLYTSSILEGHEHILPQVPQNPPIGFFMGNAGVVVTQAKTSTEPSRIESTKPQSQQEENRTEPSRIESNRETQIQQEESHTEPSHMEPAYLEPNRGEQEASEISNVQANHKEPCVFHMVEDKKEPAIVLVPPKPQVYEEIYPYAPSPFNNNNSPSTMKEIWTAIETATQEPPHRNQGAPFTIPDVFKFDFTKESPYFGPNNPDFVSPTWFPGWIPGFNLGPSKPHRRYHPQHWYK